MSICVKAMQWKSVSQIFKLYVQFIINNLRGVFFPPSFSNLSNLLKSVMNKSTMRGMRYTFFFLLLAVGVSTPSESTSTVSLQLTEAGLITLTQRSSLTAQRHSGPSPDPVRLPEQRIISPNYLNYIDTYVTKMMMALGCSDERCRTEDGVTPPPPFPPCFICSQAQIYAMCKWWDIIIVRGPRRRLWFGGILHQVKLDSVNKVGSKWNTVPGKIQECAWKEALWPFGWIFSRVKCIFLCVKWYIWLDLRYRSWWPVLICCLYIFFWLHLTPAFQIDECLISIYQIRWRKFCPKKLVTWIWRQEKWRYWTLITGSYPRTTCFFPAPPGQRSPLVLSSSFFTQLEAPAATLWLVRCSPVAHLAMGRQRVEGETRARGERGAGNGEDQIIG